MAISAAAVRSARGEVIDPELGINIVDLGLVYGVEIDGARGPHRDDDDEPGMPARRVREGPGRLVHQVPRT